MDDNLICVGAVMGAFGVRGEIRLKSFCADPSAIENYSPLATESGESYELTLVRSVKGGFGARISGVQDKEAADALREHNISGVSVDSLTFVASLDWAKRIKRQRHELAVLNPDQTRDL